MVRSIKSIVFSKPFLKTVLKDRADSSEAVYFAYVDPKLVASISLVTGSSELISGKTAITGSFYGPFDLLKSKFQNHYLYYSIELLLEGKPVTETSYFKKMLKNYSEDYVLQRFERLNKIIESVKTRGYLSQHELGNLHERRELGSFEIPLDEAVVYVDRKGELVRLHGGRHRLAIAQHLGISEIPVIISMYHEKSADKLPVKRRILTGSDDDYLPFD